MGLTYLDSSIIIHATDESDDGERVRELIRAANENEFVVSPLVRMESLVRAVRDRDSTRKQKREDFLARFSECQIKARAFELATHMRARHQLSTAEAIHVATASLNNCDEVWTTDKRLARKLPNYAIDVLEVS